MNLTETSQRIHRVREDWTANLHKRELDNGGHTVGGEQVFTVRCQKHSLDDLAWLMETLPMLLDAAEAGRWRKYPDEQPPVGARIFGKGDGVSGEHGGLFYRRNSLRQSRCTQSG